MSGCPVLEVCQTYWTGWRLRNAGGERQRRGLFSPSAPSLDQVQFRIVPAHLPQQRHFRWRMLWGRLARQAREGIVPSLTLYTHTPVFLDAVSEYVLVRLHVLKDHDRIGVYRTKSIWYNLLKTQGNTLICVAGRLSMPGEHWERSVTMKKSLCILAVLLVMAFCLSVQAEGIEDCSTSDGLHGTSKS